MLEGMDTLKRGNGRPRSCAYSTWLDTLDLEDREQAEQVLDDRSVPATSAHAFFNLNGANIPSAQTVLRHRNRTCCGGAA